MQARLTRHGEAPTPQLARQTPVKAGRRPAHGRPEDRSSRGRAGGADTVAAVGATRAEEPGPGCPVHRLRLPAVRPDVPERKARRELNGSRPFRDGPQRGFDLTRPSSVEVEGRKEQDVSGTLSSHIGSLDGCGNPMEGSANEKTDHHDGDHVHLGCARRGGVAKNGTSTSASHSQGISSSASHSSGKSNRNGGGTNLNNGEIAGGGPGNSGPGDKNSPGRGGGGVGNGPGATGGSFGAKPNTTP